MRFTIDFYYETEGTKKHKSKKLMVGGKQSFQVDQFQDGDIYYKEVHFGKGRSSDFSIADSEGPSDQPEGTVKLKVQLQRDEESQLRSVMDTCDSEVKMIEEQLQMFDVITNNRTSMAYDEGAFKEEMAAFVQANPHL